MGITVPMPHGMDVYFYADDGKVMAGCGMLARELTQEQIDVMSKIVNSGGGNMGLSAFTTEQLRNELALREALEGGLTINLRSRGSSGQDVNFKLNEKGDLVLSSSIFATTLKPIEVLQLKYLLSKVRDEE